MCNKTINKTSDQTGHSKYFKQNHKKKSNNKKTRKLARRREIKKNTKYIVYTDTDSKNTDTDSKKTDTDSKNTDTDSKKTDTDSKKTDTDSKNTDTDSKNTDTNVLSTRKAKKEFLISGRIDRALNVEKKLRKRKRSSKKKHWNPKKAAYYKRTDIYDKYLDPLFISSSSSQLLTLSVPQIISLKKLGDSN